MNTEKEKIIINKNVIKILKDNIEVMDKDTKKKIKNKISIDKEEFIKSTMNNHTCNDIIENYFSIMK